MVAAESDSGLVEYQAAVALGAALHVAAVPADHDRSGAAAIDDEDGPLARRERRESGRQRPGKKAAIAARQFGAQVDDLDPGRGAAGAFGQDRVPV